MAGYQRAGVAAALLAAAGVRGRAVTASRHTERLVLIWN